MVVIDNTDNNARTHTDTRAVDQVDITSLIYANVYISS